MLLHSTKAWQKRGQLVYGNCDYSRRSVLPLVYCLLYTIYLAIYVHRVTELLRTQSFPLPALCVPAYQHH